MPRTFDALFGTQVHPGVLSGRMGNSQMSDVGKPLCVDLDGTLVETDTFDENLALALRSPRMLGRAITALPKGKASTKSALASGGVPDPAWLPYNLAFIEWLRAQKSAGRYILLVTAANHAIARAVAEYTDLFDDVVASTPERNLRGKEKGRALVERFGEKQFVYAGNDHTDLDVWRLAAAAVVVNAPPGIEVSLGEIPIEAAFPGQRYSLNRSAIRPLCSAKNLLALIPATLLPFTTSNLLTAVLVFVSMTVLFTGLYQLGGLFNLENNRRSGKPLRIATGTHGVRLSFVLSAVLISFGWIGTVLLAGPLIPTLTVLAFMLYTGWLHQIPFVREMNLGALYLLRFLLGCAAFALSPTFAIGIAAVVICLVLGILGRRGLSAIDET